MRWFRITYQTSICLKVNGVYGDEALIIDHEDAFVGTREDAEAYASVMRRHAINVDIHEGPRP